MRKSRIVAVVVAVALALTACNGRTGKKTDSRHIASAAVTVQAGDFTPPYSIDNTIY